MSKLLKIVAPVAILAVAVTAAVMIARSGDEPEREEPTQAALLVDVVAPEIKRGSFIIRAQGSVTPRIETSLVSEVSGKIDWMSEDYVAGGVFSEGQQLARIDPSDYETALLAAEAELASARATLADEQARSDAAREDFRRLYGDTRKPTDLLLRLPQVARARAAVQAREAAVERARRDLERTKITLPFDGMIRERDANLGQYVTTGATLGKAFSTERAEVRLPISETDLAFLDIPMTESGTTIDRPVTLVGSVAGQPARWKAQLVRTEGVVDRNTRLTYLVAEVTDPYGLKANTERPALPMGTFVEAEIPGRDASGLVLLPAQALHEGNRVYLADENDELEVRKVEIVRATPREVYVSGRLDADDRVITTAIPAPVPGLKLNVRQADPEEPRLRILPSGELAAGDDPGGAGEAP
ncbi:MAG: efflux RND transporter periplasmic adaptor subunit [Wenzhouxiangellaceae bacterium]|nr:efflux RND transporter periplasmic adaptor subunit [Wenzhouxiangellaceae bacterium]MBS3746565.1 efflux RND transporter periplasmic adaptor subunit [Wenzhouxiangellaceae bacterium]MBS3824161.1 efflux RND transporter periplasmic adaptor subunit [Wenzhouxiangellaceae bacterium]